MKITVEQEKPVFKPITITLETAQEYFELLGILGQSSAASIREGLIKRDVGHLYRGYADVCGELHTQLNELIGKVKETL